MKKKKTTEDLFNKIASATKFEGYIDGKEFYSNPYIPDGIIYFLNEDTMFPKLRKPENQKAPARSK